MNNWKIWCYPISRFCQVDHTKVSTKTSVHVNHAYVSMVVESPGCITPQGLTANSFHSPTPHLAPLGGWHPLRWKSTQRAVDHNGGPRQHSQPAAWMGVVANISCLHKVLLYPVYMNFMMFIISISFEMLFMITKVMMIASWVWISSRLLRLRWLLCGFLCSWLLWCQSKGWSWSLSSWWCLWWVLEFGWLIMFDNYDD